VLRATQALLPALPAGMVGLSIPDDAAVVPVPGAPEGTPSLVLTTDFFTPIVDDPRTFGRIAAVNAISDVYAMGGIPRFALNLAAFPTKTLSLEILGAILAGGGEACAAEGVMVLGGHTVDDPEPKFGLCVIGTVDPARVWTKRGARAGDALVLTKALGTGVLATAFKRDALDNDGYEAMVASMSESNRRGAELARPLEVHAATDVTGYGLLGHLLEMLGGNDFDATLDAAAVPLLPGVRALIEAGFVPGGSTANLAFVSDRTEFAVDDTTKMILADAQTSGGLLLAMPRIVAEGFVAAYGPPAAIVGSIAAGSGRVRVG
jgi:selenide,water dikinase